MRSLINALGLVAVSCMVAFAQEEDTIEWLDNYQKAIEEATRSNKPIFLEFRCEA
jgi:hypothetical protein